MKKSKLLTALLLCTAMSLPVVSYAAETSHYSGLYEGKNTQYGVVHCNAGQSAIVEESTKFINNTSKQGGAIYNYGGNLEVQNNVTFDGNSAIAGGAIQNFGIAILGNNLIFENNKAQWGGAAIYGGTPKNGGWGSSIKIGDNAIFRNNTLTNSSSWGGAIFLENDANETVSFELGKNSTFENNSAMEGGAIYVKNAVDAIIGNGAKFTDNTATSFGGAVYNMGNTTISNASFNNNSAAVSGGAIYNAENATLDVSGIFNGNTSHAGGAIFSYIDSKLNIGDNTEFSNNSTFTEKGDAGGALYVDRANQLTIGNNVKFVGNSATSEVYEYSDGSVAKGAAGAAYIYQTNTTIGDNLLVADNKSKYAGGGLYIWNEGKEATIGKNAAFINNSSEKSYGGAIGNFDGKLTIDEGARFVGNSAGTNGGAIANMNFNSTDSEVIVGANANFDSNSAGKDGGAIYTDTAMNFTDTSFTNNSAGQNGGAIFANDNLTVSAITKDVIFAGNNASDGGDIYMNTAGSTLAINLDNEKVVTIQDGISGSNDKYNIAINGFGDVDLQSYIKNANVTVDYASLYLSSGSQVNGLNNSITMNNGSELVTVNNNIETFDNNLFTINGEVDLATDVDLATGKADSFAGAVSDASTGKFLLEGVNPIGNTTKNVVQINLYEALGLDENRLVINPNEFVAKDVLTPIRYLSGSVSETGILTYAPTGNSYKDFNPAVMASPIAAQLGGYLTQLNSYDQAFRNMDMYMLMTKKQREAMKLRNKYAAADGNLIFDPTNSRYEDKAVWFRPYATFENVPLKGGPRVSNVAYGSFFGGESDLVDLGHGWDGMLGIYAGYNGSHQSYNGISMYQNGGTLGLVGMAYKGNFFTGLTINAGANGGEASTMYGTDNFTMLMAGIASKTGYNIELADGKFIIQPNFQMSYSFVNTFDYTNAAGVRINSDPLNAIQLEPGIKFIGNLKNGWQPYAGVSVVWNIMDKTNFHANNVSLPDLSIKPYVRYGVGIRKTWGERCVGFLQTYFTNGGRNGVGIQAGFRYTLGKDKPNSTKTGNVTPELPKTQIKLSSTKSK